VSNEPGGIGTPQIAGGIAVDSAGNAYVTSATNQTTFPTTPGAYQTNSNIHPIYSTGATVIPSDVFVTKLNATGSALVYSTFLGGGTNVTSVQQHGHKTVTNGTISGGASIAVDANGDAHVTGWTNATAFATVNALQTKNAGGFDAFVTVFNPTGSGLLFSSYFGGGGTDYGYGIALDSAGNAYVGGQTGSSNFPTTAGAYQTAPGSGFALKIDPPAEVSEVSVPIAPGRTTVAIPRREALSETIPMTLLLPTAASAVPSVPNTAGMVASPPSVIVFPPIAAIQPQGPTWLSSGTEETVDHVFIDWQQDEVNPSDV
jgi:hypothetical protein